MWYFGIILLLVLYVYNKHALQKGYFKDMLGYGANSKDNIGILVDLLLLKVINPTHHLFFLFFLNFLI